MTTSSDIRNQALRDAAQMVRDCLATFKSNNPSTDAEFFLSKVEASILAMQEPASEPRNTACIVNPVMSNVCSRGTKSCIIDHTWEPASEPAPAETYPEGVTMADHIAHDMRAGRFPNRTTIEQFLIERAASEPAPASAPSELRDVALGDTYLEAGADLHTSGINVGKHGNRIQCYGRKPEDAEALRDEVWRALTAPASAPSCCGALEGLKLSFISGAIWMRDNPAKTAEAWIEKAASESAAAIRARAQPCQCGELREALERIAASNVRDFSTLHPDNCALVARQALAALSTGPRSEDGK